MTHPHHLPTFNVHIYREMRVFFPGITASTLGEAAQLAAAKPTDEAEYTEDCDGASLAALVDVVGDSTFEQSRMIDFDPARRDAATDVPANTITIQWHIDDVREVRPDLADDQCREVLHNIKRYHDANVGVTWEVIQVVADILYPLLDGESKAE